MPVFGGPEPHILARRDKHCFLHFSLPACLPARYYGKDEQGKPAARNDSREMKDSLGENEGEADGPRGGMRDSKRSSLKSNRTRC
ncbi:Hypothetical protein NTJ_06893 [Nesidiocoris tenuis]|uniref:Uncharacterized protein n=1 Tax=Nesidiocoris tenuis TaxID=355587 RepID=A0ABN7ARJ5_9HEMI|nr:Hypothetical protein NTJ_06893 [Nesidiocoris tenuis]